MQAYLDARRAPLLAGKSPRDIAPELARRLIGSRPAPGVIEELVASISALRKDSYGWQHTYAGPGNYTVQCEIANLEKTGSDADPSARVDQRARTWSCPALPMLTRLRQRERELWRFVLPGGWAESLRPDFG